MRMTKHKKIVFFEVLIMAVLYLLLLYSSLQGNEDYVFVYPFNLKDGSIYWSLFFSVFFSGKNKRTFCTKKLHFKKMFVLSDL